MKSWSRTRRHVPAKQVGKWKWTRLMTNNEKRCGNSRRKRGKRPGKLQFASLEETVAGNFEQETLITFATRPARFYGHPNPTISRVENQKPKVKRCVQWKWALRWVSSENAYLGKLPVAAGENSKSSCIFLSQWYLLNYGRWNVAGFFNPTNIFNYFS